MPKNGNTGIKHKENNCKTFVDLQLHELFFKQTINPYALTILHVTTLSTVLEQNIILHQENSEFAKQ